ncbi:MAG: deoxyribose-phosphate aldolase [Clostridia bacterium]|nr:deoxyribose-phosphate aldolase [Clostridia bacterium]
MLNSYIDHTLLKSDATTEQIIQLCQEARDYSFASVCVNSCHVELAAKELAGSSVKICTVVGFPLGASLSSVKAFEAAQSAALGADEIDMVINIGALKDGNLIAVEEDIRTVKSACGNAHLKVIIETCLLTYEEKKAACICAKNAGADFVKTSTGFSKSGATVEDVALMRQTVGADMGVKAAGGIRTKADALAMINAGATRLGASAGIKIVSED